MNFLSPTSLFLFGLAIPIIALYILRLRRRREPVSTLMFWDGTVQGTADDFAVPTTETSPITPAPTSISGTLGICYCATAVRFYNEICSAACIDY